MNVFRTYVASGALLATLSGCAEAKVDPATYAPVMASNVLKPEFTHPRPGTAHVRLFRVAGALGKGCDAVVQVSFHSLAEGRIADVAKIWDEERLDLYLDPGDYRLNIYTALCSLPPTDVDVTLKAGDDVTYRLTTTGLNMWLSPQP
jgi:hypothetical protein